MCTSISPNLNPYTISFHLHNFALANLSRNIYLVIFALVFATNTIFFWATGEGGVGWEGGGGELRLCDRFGHWSIHCSGNISTEYYTVRTVSSSASSSQGLASHEHSLKLS